MNADVEGSTNEKEGPIQGGDGVYCLSPLKSLDEGSTPGGVVGGSSER